MIKFTVGSNIPEDFLKKTSFKQNEDTCSLIPSNPFFLLISLNKISPIENFLLSNAHLKVYLSVIDKIPFLVFSFFVNEEDQPLLFDSICINMEELYEEHNALNIFINDSSNKILRNLRVVGLQNKFIKCLQDEVKEIKDESRDTLIKKGQEITNKYSSADLVKLAKMSCLVKGNIK